MSRNIFVLVCLQILSIPLSVLSEHSPFLGASLNDPLTSSYSEPIIYDNQLTNQNTPNLGVNPHHNDVLHQSFPHQQPHLQEQPAHPHLHEQPAVHHLQESPSQYHLQGGPVQHHLKNSPDVFSPVCAPIYSTITKHLTQHKQIDLYETRSRVQFIKETQTLTLTVYHSQVVPVYHSVLEQPVHHVTVCRQPDQLYKQPF